MKLSNTKIYNIKKINKNINTSLLLENAGYIKQIQSGLYVKMNLIKRVINNIESIIKKEIELINGLEIELNQLQSTDMWKQTDRYDKYGNEMFKMIDRNQKEMMISGTNEEIVTLMAKDYIKSYKDMSLLFYQINNKFRDEIRCSGGLFRTKEFSMMDAYSFHKDESDLSDFYLKVKQTYINIFNKLGLKYEIKSADAGEIGGSISEEFVVMTSEGEIEIGHIFQLGTKYSSMLDLTFTDKDNSNKNVFMGCYGIGITRLAQVLADIGRIGDCLNFNENVSAYKYGIVIADINNESQNKIAESIFNQLIEKGISAYIDDRNIGIGQKLHEIDTIGTSNKILIGNNIQNGYYEKKRLSTDKWDKVYLSSNS